MKSRTALITAASVIAVLLTGTVALGANLQILAAESATVIEGGAGSDTIDLALETTDTSTGPVEHSTVQAFTVDRAGTLTVEFDDDELRLVDVAPNNDWEWVINASTATELEVAFSNGDQAIRFVAHLLPDGSISANVDEQITKFVRDPATIVERQQAALTLQPSAAPTFPPGVAAAFSSATSGDPERSAPALTSAPSPTSSPTPQPTPTPQVTHTPAATTDDQADDDSEDDDSDHDHDHDDDKQKNRHDEDRGDDEQKNRHDEDRGDDEQRNRHDEDEDEDEDEEDEDND